MHCHVTHSLHHSSGQRWIKSLFDVVHTLFIASCTIRYISFCSTICNNNYLWADGTTGDRWSDGLLGVLLADLYIIWQVQFFLDKVYVWCLFFYELNYLYTSHANNLLITIGSCNYMNAFSCIEPLYISTVNILEM